MNAAAPPFRLTIVHPCVGRRIGQRRWWLLITSGFRTYRFLPVFWREFWPRRDRPTPARLQGLRLQLAQWRYGPCLDLATGVVRFAQPQPLLGALRDVPAGRAADPHTAFFLATNPGHHRGDELVTLTPLDEANLTRACRRMLGEGLAAAGAR